MTELDAYRFAYWAMQPLEGRCEPHLLQQLADRIANNLPNLCEKCRREDKPMTISQYISKLQAELEAHGDLPIKKTCNAFRDATEPPDPVIAYMEILEARKRKPRFWVSHQSVRIRGEKVLRI